MHLVYAVSHTLYSYLGHMFSVSYLRTREEVNTTLWKVQREGDS